jgi:hypothetical protein
MGGPENPTLPYMPAANRRIVNAITRTRFEQIVLPSFFSRCGENNSPRRQTTGIPRIAHRNRGHGSGVVESLAAVTNSKNRMAHIAPNLKDLASLLVAIAILTASQFPSLLYTIPAHSPM